MNANTDDGMRNRTGSVGLSHNSISKKIGKLFIERNNVNLHFDVLDTPEFFWEQVHITIPYHTIIILVEHSLVHHWSYVITG
jgi:uncharacterized Rmd1/YagE family protein